MGKMNNPDVKPDYPCINGHDKPRWAWRIRQWRCRQCEAETTAANREGWLQMDPEGFRARQAEYGRRYRAKKKARQEAAGE